MCRRAPKDGQKSTPNGGRSKNTVNMAGPGIDGVTILDWQERPLDRDLWSNLASPLPSSGTYLLQANKKKQDIIT